MATSSKQQNWERSIPREQSWGGCRLCKHFRPDLTCAAYPERIPIQIFSGELDHLVVRPEQVDGVLFEPVEHPTGIARRLSAARSVVR